MMRGGHVADAGRELGALVDASASRWVDCLDGDVLAEHLAGGAVKERRVDGGDGEFVAAAEGVGRQALRDPGRRLLRAVGTGVTRAQRSGRAEPCRERSAELIAPRDGDGDAHHAEGHRVAHRRDERGGEKVADEVLVVVVAGSGRLAPPGGTPDRSRRRPTSWRRSRAPASREMANREIPSAVSHLQQHRPERVHVGAGRIDVTECERAADGRRSRIGGNAVGSAGREVVAVVVVVLRRPELAQRVEALVASVALRAVDRVLRNRVPAC